MKYIAVYKQLLKANWYALIEYRVDFVSKVTSAMVFSFWHVLAVFLLTYNVPTAFGWTRNELLLLSATYSVFIGLYHAFISRNMARIADEVYFGRLDFLLLKPLDSQMSASFWLVDYISLLRCVFGLLLTVYFVNMLHVVITPFHIMTYIFTIIVGIGILYSLWLSVVSLTIFYPRLSNIIALLFHLTNIARYPQEMYSKLPAYLSLSLLPFALIMTTPTKVLLQKFNGYLGLEIITLLLVLSAVARFIWTRSLRYYTGASS